jgi:N-acetylmuramoyl-L-alanine amidase
MSRKIIAVLMILVFFFISLVGAVSADTPATVTVQDEANIRSGAGTAFSIIQVGHKGDKFEVLGSAKDTSGRSWYKVKAGSSAGYVAGWLVTYSPATVTPKPPAPPATPAATVTPVASGRFAVVIEDGTSLRSGAGTSFSRLATMKPGTSLAILGEAKDSSQKVWYKVDCSSLKLKQTAGYVASWVVKVKVQDATPSTPVSLTASSILALWKMKARSDARTIDAANLRSGPSVLFDRTAVLSVGSSVVIAGYALNDQAETWCWVSAGEKSGWVYAPLLSAWDKVPSSVASTTLGRALFSVASSARLVDSPFESGSSGASAAKGMTITGVATDGKQIFLELSTDASPGKWLAMDSGTTVGGIALRANTCSLTSIEVVSSSGWTAITLHIDGDKTGLSIVAAHNPEQIEVSLPSLIQSGQLGIAGVPTGQVSGIKVSMSSSGFVSRIVISLAAPAITMKQSVNGSTVQLLLSAPGVVLPSKAVFLKGELVASSEETFFAQNATFVPLVNVANVYGLLLSWDAANQQTSLTFGGRQYVVKDGLRTLKIAQGDNHWNEEMAVAPKIVGGLLYVPTATVAHVFSLDVTGDALRVYLDPIISSISLTGASDTAPRSITLTAASDLKVTKSGEGDDTLLQFEGVISPALGTGPLASWLSIVSTARKNDVPPSVGLRIHAPAATIDVQSRSPGEYVVTVGNASKGKLAGKKIVLDPGHGYVLPNGSIDSGATGPAGTKESSVNLAIALKAKSLLEADGAIVIMTRLDDSSIDNPDLVKRVQITNSSGADLFLSIHENATDVGTATGGTETHYWFDQSQVFAELLQKSMVAALQRSNDGVDKTSLYLISHIDTMPAVLVECAYISNPEEERLLRQESFQQKTAGAIEAAIVEYFSR